MFFALGQQTGTLQGRTQGEVQDDRTHGGGHAVYKGDAACNFGQRLCHGVFLTKDVHIAEVAKEPQVMPMMNLSTKVVTA